MNQSELAWRLIGNEAKRRYPEIGKWRHREWPHHPAQLIRCGLPIGIILQENVKCPNLHEGTCQSPTASWGHFRLTLVKLQQGQRQHSTPPIICHQSFWRGGVLKRAALLDHLFCILVSCGEPSCSHTNDRTYIENGSTCPY